MKKEEEEEEVHRRLCDSLVFISKMSLFTTKGQHTHPYHVPRST